MRDIGHGAVFFLSAVLFCLVAASHANANDIPLGSRVYPMLNDLQYTGYISGHIYGTRPVTTDEARRLIKEAKERKASEDKARPFPVPYLETLDHEVSLGLGDAWFEFKPISTPEIQFLYLEGENSSIPGINASQNSLVYNNNGIDPGEGPNGYLRFTVEGKGGPISFSITPLFSVDGSKKGIIEEGYVKLHAIGLDLEAGKIPLWWGQGYHGTLFLGNNAEPLPMVRLTNPSPFLLPWFFRYLGPFRFDIFVSTLEAERVVPRPYFAGARIDFRPLPMLEIGLTRTIQAFGEGRPSLTFGRVLDALFGSNKKAPKDLSNSIGGVDVRLNLPLVQVYGELGGEDQRGGFPSFPFAYIVGAYLPLIDHGMDFRVEFADISSKSWYSHAVYQSGYTYKGRVLGHHVGRGGRDLFAEMGFLKTSRLNGRVNFDYENRGIETVDIKEKHYQLGTSWGYLLGRAFADWRLDLDLAYERINNFNNTSGDTRDNSLISVSIIGGI